MLFNCQGEGKERKTRQVHYRKGNQNIENGPFLSHSRTWLNPACLTHPITPLHPLQISWLKGKPAFVIPNTSLSPCYFRDGLKEVMYLTLNYASDMKETWFLENLPGCFPSHSFSERNLGPLILQELCCESQVRPRHCFFFLWLSFQPLPPEGRRVFPCGFPPHPDSFLPFFPFLQLWGWWRERCVSIW